MVWDKKPPETLSEFDRLLVGNSRRLTLPLGDRYLMHQMADLLRGLAGQIDFWARGPHDLPLRASAFQIAAEIASVNSRIRTLAKQYDIEIREGRPPNGASEAGHKLNGSGTGVTDKSETTPHVAGADGQ